MYIWWNRNFIPTDLQCPGDGTCSNQGTCNVSTGICVCGSGFQGQTCQGKTIFLLINKGIWNSRCQSILLNPKNLRVKHNVMY